MWQILMVFNTDILSRGLSSRNAEEITHSSRLVFRWRELDPCVSCKFHGDVTFGAADHGERAQEEIRALIGTFHGLMLCLLSSAFVPLS